jgi:hypothetical protein
MIVDAEMGLPLDLSRWDALWDDAADDSGAFGVFLVVRICGLTCIRRQR